MVEIGQMAAVVGVLALLALTLWFLRKRGFAGVAAGEEQAGAPTGVPGAAAAGAAPHAPSGAHGRDVPAGGLLAGRMLAGPELPAGRG